MRRLNQILSLIAGVASIAEAQNAVFKVRVISDNGGRPGASAITGANVYINDLAISVMTDSNGLATLTAPAQSDTARQNIYMRVRALGHVPARQLVNLKPGNFNVLFELKPDPGPRDSVQVPTGSATVFGKVTTESGAAIEGATLYVPQWATSTRSAANGTYSIKVELGPDRGRRITLDVRAAGYAPHARAVIVGTTPEESNFQLKESAFRDEVLARPPVLYSGAQAAQAAQLQADPFGRFLFTPEMVMQHQDAIGLNESQREALQVAITQAQSQVIKMQWALALDGEKLTKALNKAILDEKEVLAQVDRVIMIEREIKRAQMTMMIKIKNTLTQSQQAKLRILKG